MKKRIVAGISTALLALSMGTGMGFAGGGETVEINAQVLNVRTDADINSDIIYKAQMGQEFPVVSSEGEWVSIRLDNGRNGWVNSNYVKTTQSSSNGMITADNVNFRQGASLEAPSAGTLSSGQSVDIVEVSGDWTRIRLANGAEGFVYSSFVDVESGTSTVNRGGARSSHVVEVATSKLGARYSRGAAGPDAFDCSGFVTYVYKEAYGKSIPRSSTAQYSAGTSIDKDELEIGDIVFFATGGSSSVNHSGIYIGNGKFIHASSYDGKVLIDDMDSGHYSNVYKGARRM